MFETNRFMLYMKKNYDLNDYAKEVLLGVVAHGVCTHNNFKDQFAFFLANSIPKLSVRTVAHFCSKDMLSDALYESSREL